MVTSHFQYHYSVTLHTDDIAVLHCLRALCQHWAGGPYPQIGWGGSNQNDWKLQGGNLVLRFSGADRRASFLADAKRLLAGHWSEVSQDDYDPAEPQR